MRGQQSHAMLPSGSISAAVLEVGEEGVFADRMLHPVSLDHRCAAGGYPMRMNSDVAMWSVNEVVLLPIARTGVRYGATC